MNTNVNQMKSQASNMAENAVSEGKEELNNLKDASSKTVNELASKAQKAGKVIGDDAKGIVQCATNYARDKPLEALGLAVIAGFVIKRFMR